MSTGITFDGSHAGIDGLCEQIRGALEGWVPRLLGVHVHGTASGPAEVARLVAAVADAAELTVLPGDGATARAELHTAATKASTAADEQSGTDTRAELVAVRAGCRRTAVAVGLRVPVACENPEVLPPAPLPRRRPTHRPRRW
ncbi:hypothetical protein [Streptomyces virginiae]|uniref:Uncharacterized protein n=1 Tax=Streptomyces virginiae TaxID=1961 RepID=A0ABZ1TUQ7_STRVG|nr:hypothetical protein [Streptomyces virginiae]